MHKDCNTCKLIAALKIIVKEQNETIKKQQAQIRDLRQTKIDFNSN